MNIIHAKLIWSLKGSSSGFLSTLMKEIWKAEFNKCFCPRKNTILASFAIRDGARGRHSSWDQKRCQLAISFTVLLCVDTIPSEWYMHMFNTANQILGCRQLVLIALVPVRVFTTISYKFLLVLGFGCYYCRLLVGRVGWGCYKGAEVQSLTAVTVPYPPYQNQSSCTLTLALPKNEA